MSWFKLDENLPDHPKLKLLEELLDDEDAIARLTFLWCWCLKYSPSGDISKFSVRTIAKAARFTGDPKKFMAAMIETGFIDVSDDECCIHDWQDWQGRLIELKERNRDRQRTYRERHNDKTSSNALVTRYEDVTEPLRTPTRGDENRGDLRGDGVAPLHVASEIDRVAPPPLAAAPPQAGPADESPAAPKEQYPSDFVAFWQSYRRPAGKGSKPAALREWRKLNAAYRGLAIKELATFQASKDWQKESGQYIPHAERYLKLQLFLSPPEPGNGNGHGRDSPGHDPNCPWCRGTGVKINHLLSGDVEAPCTCRR